MTDLDKALILILQRVNAARVSSSHDMSQGEKEEVLEVLRQASYRLAVYGSLAPDQLNHSVIQDIRGEWVDGFVRGKLTECGWGSGIGYPAIASDQDGDPVPVMMLVSSRLPDHWKRLDEFEGAEYARILVPVQDEGGGFIAVANIYVLTEGIRLDA